MCCYIGVWVWDVLLYWGVGEGCVAILGCGLGMCCYIGGG